MKCECPATAFDIAVYVMAVFGAIFLAIVIMSIITMVKAHRQDYERGRGKW